MRCYFGHFYRSKVQIFTPNHWLVVLLALPVDQIDNRNFCLFFCFCFARYYWLVVLLASPVDQNNNVSPSLFTINITISITINIGLCMMYDCIICSYFSLSLEEWSEEWRESCVVFHKYVILRQWLAKVYFTHSCTAFLLELWFSVVLEGVLNGALVTKWSLIDI